MHLNDNTQLQGGKYRIRRFIAQGGFGITYEGEHVLLGQRIAIKEFFAGNFCQRDSDGNVSCTQVSAPLVDKLRGKFIAEARTLHQLNHPGIVKVHDVFEENGTAYYVMDFIDGESLDSVIKRHNGKLPESLLRKYLDDVTDALSYLHQRNRLHLDIKPANIMIDRSSGRAKLIDFGVSKQYDEENGQNTSTLVGKTPGYAPIEQLNSDVQKFTPATDIYALGATLYKALSGIVPPSPSEILEEGLPPLPSDVSPQMQRIIKKAMEVKRTDRYPTIDAMMHDLNGQSASDEATEIDIKPKPEPQPAPKPEKPQNKKKPNKYLWFILAGVVVIGAAIAIFASQNSKKSVGSVYDDDAVAVKADTTKVAAVLDTVFDPNNITQEDLFKFANFKYEPFDGAVDNIISQLYRTDGDADSIMKLTMYLATKGYSDAYVRIANYFANGREQGHYKNDDRSTPRLR
ncbi:MAG: serine/threonine protein kinase, partial [Muribaculaceae bacterium]|nr:serine/threonine protein kinase [Muribaculaceae bacterium]